MSYSLFIKKIMSSFQLSWFLLPLVAGMPLLTSACGGPVAVSAASYAADGGMNDTPRTTLVVAVVQAGVAYWAHCGDSRLYFVRAGELLARTRDHSYLEQRRDARRVQPLPEGMNRNVLYTCLGSPAKPVYDITGPVPLQQGDKVLLCSDGLWGSLEDVDIVYHLGQ